MRTTLTGPPESRGTLPEARDEALLTGSKVGLVRHQFLLVQCRLSAHTPPDLRWFWPITVYVDPKLGINTSRRAASLDEAKAQFLSNWQSCRADSTPSGQRST